MCVYRAEVLNLMLTLPSIGLGGLQKDGTTLRLRDSNNTLPVTYWRHPTVWKPSVTPRKPLAGLGESASAAAASLSRDFLDADGSGCWLPDLE